MIPWQERVTFERSDLNYRLEKLSLFIGEDDGKFVKLALLEQELLVVQAFHMMRYLAVLDERIDSFKETD